jgi:hypothetical protein
MHSELYLGYHHLLHLLAEYSQDKNRFRNNEESGRNTFQNPLL